MTIYNSPPKTYILILNYCSFDDTVECANSVRASTYPNYNILVIDNDSPDGSGQQLNSTIPHEEFLQLPFNTGYAGGNNEGIKIALSHGAKYVFIINPDVRLTENSITSYIEFMELNPDVSALNPIQVRGDNTNLDEFFAKEVFDGNAIQRPDFPIQPGLSWEVKSLFGAALLLRRSTLESIGGFDPLYFAYWEEMDLCRRIRYHAGKLVVISDHPVQHLRNYQDSNINKFRSFLRLKGMYLYQLKSPALAFRIATKRTFKSLISDIFNGKREFGNGLFNYIKILLWLIWNLPAIKRHRQMDRNGRSYI